MSNVILPLDNSVIYSEFLQGVIEASIKRIPDSNSTIYLLLLSQPQDLKECEVILDKLYHLVRTVLSQINIDISYYIIFTDTLKSTKIKFNKVLILPGVSQGLPQELGSIDSIEIETPKYSISVKEDDDNNQNRQDSSSRKVDQFETVAVGGTFDHLHDGHKILLTVSAYLASKKLIIGVTVDELLVNKKYKEVLQSYGYRVDAVRELIAMIKPTLEVEFHELRDICGPTATVKEIDALVLSSETASGGGFVNKTRLEKGFPALEIVEVSVIGGGTKDDGWKDKLSSTNFRKVEYEKLHKLTK